MLHGAALYSCAFLVGCGLIFVNAIDPYSGATASPYFQMVGTPAYGVGAQSVTASDAGADVSARDAVSGVQRKAAVPALSASTGDAAAAQAIAQGMMAARGWDEEQFQCLVALWNRESHWNVNSHNVSSGAHGIPQALPGSKMASAGADWETNPATQITWGLGYISGRYGSPCGAWQHSEDVGWY